MAFDGRRPQFLGSKRVRYVFEQRPHVGHIVKAAIKKDGNARTYPKVYPCSNMPQTSSFSRGRNGVSHESEANTEVHGEIPILASSRMCHGFLGQTARKLSTTEPRSQQEIPSIPSAAALWIPRTCVASKFYPDDISRTPRRRLRAPERGSSPPRHRRTQFTVASLSPRNKARSPVADGQSAHEDTKKNADTTMPKRSSTSIDKSSAPRTYLLEP